MGNRTCDSYVIVCWISNSKNISRAHFKMRLFTLICLVVYLSIISEAAFVLDGGRNDGEPDYDSGFIQVRDGGRNEGEPHCDPHVSLEVRDGGRNDGEPDYDPMGANLWNR